MKIDDNSDKLRLIDLIGMGFGLLLALAVLIEPYVDARPDHQPPQAVVAVPPAAPPANY